MQSTNHTKYHNNQLDICIYIIDFIECYSHAYYGIGFNHGLPWCVRYMARGPPVTTKPDGKAGGFCGDRRPEGHVFHTSRQAMIKTYFIALWWWFCPCRVGGAVWNHTAWLFPLMPLPTLSLFYSYFLFGNEYRKTSLEKILGNFSFVSIYYHWNWFEDLHHVQGIEIKDESETLHSQYLRENNGTTCHHGHPADCQLALTNVVEVQTKVVTND